jgi:1-acyl-sn-glycerol-3-phosphate acyltransferase
LGIFPQGKIVKEPVIEKVNKGFILFAKKFKADIVPVGICGFDGYAKKLFEKNMTIKIGKPISYELDEDEIVREWARQISEFTGFENRVEQKELVNVS